MLSIRTLKQAKLLLEPELHKYLPVDVYSARTRAGATGTELVLHVVSDLTAMGWPNIKEEVA
jgi:hypothetical protein